MATAAKQKPRKKKKRKTTAGQRLRLTKIPTYSEIKQMVEALQKRMLLEPAQETQSPDIIVYQNGVLHLGEADPRVAFVADSEAPIKHSHAVWSYFNTEIWDRAVGWDLYTMDEKSPGKKFKDMAAFVAMECPVFYRYMCEWFPKDAAVSEVILRWFGYSMTTDTRQNKFMFFYGPTRAGKGSLARLLCGIVGSINYSAANYRALEDKFEAIGMHDKLVVTMEEIEATQRTHEKRLGMLKKLLGGERVPWQNKHEKQFEDQFIGKIIMQSNELLAYEDKGQSVRARMVPMEFKESFLGSGEEPPEAQIFNNREMGAIATIAGMCWYRMRRNRIKGAFEFNSENWSIKNCPGCVSGRGVLTLEGHKSAFGFLQFLSRENKEKEVFRKQIKKGELIVCTRHRLKELTELINEYNGRKTEISSLSRLLVEAVGREFKWAKPVCFRFKGLGRQRGWRGLYINLHDLQLEYPEVYDSFTESEDSGESIFS